MSLLLQIALGALVVGGVSFGVWNHKHNNEIIRPEPPTTMNDRAKATVQANVSLTTGTANADLDKDMASIDSQLKLVNESSADVDQSMNDKPVNQ